MNIYEANMFDSRKLNLRLITNALKLDKQLTGSYKDRLCTLCHKLEDEIHVICECPRNDTCRKLYIRLYYIRKPSLAKLIQHLDTHNISEM